MNFVMEKIKKGWGFFVPILYPFIKNNSNNFVVHSLLEVSNIGNQLCEFLIVRFRKVIYLLLNLIKFGEHLHYDLRERLITTSNCVGNSHWKNAITVFIV